MAIAPLTSMLEPLLEWDPFRPLTLWDRPSRQMQVGMEAGAVADARVDWIETNESHIIKADLPGMRKEDITVQVEDGNVLTISGEKKREQQEQTDRYHRMERSYGRFERRFRLPADSKLDEVKAQVDHGVLTVTVPKIPEKKPEVKAIDISG